MQQEQKQQQEQQQQQQQEVGIFGVFDGHGGPAASAFVRDRLFDNLLAHPLYAEDLPKAMEEAYRTTDQQYM